jgi:transposase
MARVEILAGRERRRFWSDEQKRAILAESATSGFPAAAIARRHDIAPQQLYTWRRLARAEGRPAKAPKFLPVVVGAGAEPAPEASRRAVGGARVEVCCANGRSLQIDACLDAEILKALIRAVEAA